MHRGFFYVVEMPRFELGSEKIHRQTSTSVVGLFWFHRMRPSQQGHHPTSRLVLGAVSGVPRGTPAFVTPTSRAAGGARGRRGLTLGRPTLG